MKNKNLLYAVGGVVGGAAIAVVIMLSLNSGSNLKGMLPSGPVSVDQPFRPYTTVNTAAAPTGITPGATNNPASRTLAPLQVTVTPNPFDLKNGSVTFSADINIKNDNNVILFEVLDENHMPFAFACADSAFSKETIGDFAVQGNITRSNGKITCTWAGKSGKGIFATPGNYWIYIFTRLGDKGMILSDPKSFKIIDSRLNPSPKVLIK